MSLLGTIEESGLSVSTSPASNQNIHTDSSSDASDEEQFVYPGAVASSQPSPQPATPSPAQLESLYAASSSGDLPLLKRLFRNALDTGDVQPFALANDASTRTGFTALHAAASRGYLDIVQWLVEECGAMPDLVDKEGETALHKAALNGHFSVVTYLLPDKADVHAKDNDGWTALHNACSKGYLDIVRWLCESGGAATPVLEVSGVDVRSNGGWTPLMNASSKGHLPVVLYLLNKQRANPLIRNNWGETSYDAAAAVFEIWICEVLQKAEAEKWRGTTAPYDPIKVHTTVPIIMYENQRLDARLKTLAVSGGRPKFSASGLGRPGRRAPFELKLPKVDEETGAEVVPAWRSDIQLPTLEDPWSLPKIAPKSREHPPNSQRSHFWLSDFTLDVTHPSVHAEDGWQYAHSFADADDQWTAEVPPQLERLLSGHSVVAGMTTPIPRDRSSPVLRRGSGSSSYSQQARTAQTWVRRRRWVRVMRRRLDIEPLPFLEPDGSMYHLAADGTLLPYIDDSNSNVGDHDGQELGSMPTSFLTSTQDYVARARYLVGSQSRDTDSTTQSLSPVDVRRAIAKLERATTELRQGILSDVDGDRKTQAEVLLNAYSRELERRRLAAGAQGVLITAEDDEQFVYDDGDSSDEEFHYPGASSLTDARPPSIRSGSVDYFNSRASSSLAQPDLTPQLSHAPEFRVPTHEAPQKVMTPRWTAPTPHQVHAQWERDETVHECRDCQRRFNFLNRRHCRRCGKIFCDRCSSHRAVLDPTDIVSDPSLPDVVITFPTSQRVCQSCSEEVNAAIPGRLQSRTASLERIVVDQERLMIPGHLRDSSSQLSDLAECPVCNHPLGDLGTSSEQESHVRTCLEGGGNSDRASTPQPAKYLVYRLPAESTLIGTECVICLEEFVAASLVARLSCLCSFHSVCLSSWLQRGRSCPVHAR